MSKKYYVFYVECYDDLSRVFDTEADLLEFVAKSKASEGEGCGIIKVIYGEEVEFEPVEVATKWRIAGEVTKP